MMEEYDYRTMEDESVAQKRRIVSREPGHQPEATPEECPMSDVAAEEEILLEVLKVLKNSIAIIAAIGIILKLSVFWGGLALLASGDSREFTPMDICYHGMKAVFEKSDNGELLHENFLEDIKKHQYNFDRILSIKIADSSNCTVTARFTDGIRRYRVRLEQSPRFKHGRRIYDAGRVR